MERWFGLIAQRAIRRGSLSSVKDLVQKIDAFVQHYNRSHRPFVWTATADSILQKIARLCSHISGTAHYYSYYWEFPGVSTSGTFSLNISLFSRYPRGRKITILVRSLSRGRDPARGGVFQLHLLPRTLCGGVLGWKSTPQARSGACPRPSDVFGSEHHRARTAPARAQRKV